MDFARKILQNYGWKDGDGLGKNKSGIAKPLKPTLKFDTAGFGADQAADDFNNHWWERVFNEAATNINITQEGKQIKMKLKDENNSVEISTKGYSMKRLKKLKSCGEIAVKNSSYGNFMQAATLNNLGSEVVNPDRIDTNIIDFSKVNVLTDDELFKACGGRTAHKGARHGLKLSGKLLRIEQQEGELLAKMLEKKSSFNEAKETDLNLERQRKNKTKTCEESNELCEIMCVKADKIKKRKCKDVSAETDTNVHEIACMENKKKKKANKKNKIAKNSETQTSQVEYISEKDIDDKAMNKSGVIIADNIAEGEVYGRLHIKGDKMKKMKRKLSEVAGTEMDSNIPDIPLIKNNKSTNKKIRITENNVGEMTQEKNDVKMNSETKIMSNKHKISHVEKIEEKKNKKKYKN